MAEIVLDVVKLPKSEYSVKFLQGMMNRMIVGNLKYGSVKETTKVFDIVDNIKKRLALYEETGNTEWLMDVANCAMIEFMHPSHPEAHFRGTDSRESPGYQIAGTTRTWKRHEMDIPASVREEISKPQS
jgi:hypothetical protein